VSSEGNLDCPPVIAIATRGSWLVLLVSSRTGSIEMPGLAQGCPPCEHARGYPTRPSGRSTRSRESGQSQSRVPVDSHGRRRGTMSNLSRILMGAEPLLGQSTRSTLEHVGFPRPATR
jgi:hypothetical protein